MYVMDENKAYGNGYVFHGATTFNASGLRACPIFLCAYSRSIVDQGSTTQGGRALWHGGILSWRPVFSRVLMCNLRSFADINSNSKFITSQFITVSEQCEQKLFSNLWS
jgi:hypothetical protein